MCIWGIGLPTTEYGLLHKGLFLLSTSPSHLHLWTHAISSRNCMQKTSGDTVALDTGFYSKLISSSDGSTVDTDIFTDATRMEVLGKNFYSVRDADVILVPVHLVDHWALAAVDLVNTQIWYFDSLHLHAIKGKEVLSNLIAWLDDLWQRAPHFRRPKSPPRWTLQLDPAHSPYQNNTWDCGVFVIKLAEMIMRGVSPLHGCAFPRDLSLRVPALRPQIARSLMSGEIVG